MRIFVTGSGGIIGRHLVQALSHRTPQATILCNSADLTDPAAIAAESARAGPLDLVIHLAAIVPVATVEANPAQAFAVNVGGTINLLQALATSPARLLLCSSAHVYAPCDAALTEESPTEPLTLYGRTKLMAEEAADSICAQTARSLCIARLFSIHDPAQTGSYLRPALGRRFADLAPGATMTLQGGDSLRDFLPAETAAARIVDLALTPAQGVVNVASGTPIRVRDFAQSLAPFPVTITATGTSQHLIADVTRLRHLIGETHVTERFDHHPDLQPRGHAATGH